MLDSKPNPKRRKRGAEMIGLLVEVRSEKLIQLTEFNRRSNYKGTSKVHFCMHSRS